MLIWEDDRNEIDDIQFKTKTNTDLKRLQQKKRLRYQFINNVQNKDIKLIINRQRLENTFNRILTHKFWGYIIFFLIL